MFKVFRVQGSPEEEKICEALLFVLSIVNCFAYLLVCSRRTRIKCVGLKGLGISFGEGLFAKEFYFDCVYYICLEHKNKPR